MFQNAHELSLSLVNCSSSVMYLWIIVYCNNRKAGTFGKDIFRLPFFTLYTVLYLLTTIHGSITSIIFKMKLCSETTFAKNITCYTCYITLKSSGWFYRGSPRKPELPWVIRNSLINAMGWKALCEKKTVIYR